ncbi:tyrosine-type recombinase/integrase [Rhodovulum sulfidophilum]|nr:tyrosine-type recombinase/integrase [Rhodovulum sulfidophilum]
MVPMNSGARAALMTAKEAALSDRVIEWAGAPVTSIRKGVQRAVNSACLKDVSPDVLRQTSAVHMADAGMPVSEISQYLGHSNVLVTARFHAWDSPSQLRRAADVSDFTTLR